MDEFQERMLRNQRTTHEEKILEAAREIRKYAECIDRDLTDGRLPGTHADRVLAAAQTITYRLAMLAAMNDVIEVIETSDEPAEPRQRKLPREAAS